MNSAVQSYCPAVPENPEQDFVQFKNSFGDVYAMAASLQKMFAHSREPLVCLATENRAVLAAALLAALAGKVRLLLPNALSKRALARMQQATGFGAALAEQKNHDLLPSGIMPFWPEHHFSGSLTGEFSYHNDLVSLFTGGTTGAPSIWAKSGENLFAEAAFLAEYFHITAADCIVATVSPCHIYGLLFTVLLPLVSSATVLAETPSFPAEIEEAIQKNSATILAAVPAHYRALRHKSVNPGSLRLAVSSAGMLASDDNDAFVAHNTTAVVEVYGSTETGGIATRNRAAGEQDFTPFATVDWKVSNGRLAVRSPYVSARTHVDRDGFFITGDRVDSDGGDGFILKGRADTITKVGGERVDLDEVAEALRKQPEVEDCFVLSLPGPGGRENRICALVQSADFHKELVFSGLQSLLEPAALPRLIRAVPRMPMTRAGKYDQAAIRKLLSP